MKKAILIFYGVLICFSSWAQDDYLADAAKTKAQNSPVSIRTPDHEGMRVMIYPNPTDGTVRLTLAGFKGRRTELRVLNVIGNVVHREIWAETDDHFTKTIDLTKQAKGLYYVKLQTEDFSQIRKIIIE